MIAQGAQAVLDREASDEALVERVRNGDDGAFEDLYRRHASVAMSVARKMLGSREDAEDAAAEAFTNVFSALRRQVGPREMFRPYLLACVRNSCVLRIRQRSKQACTRDRGVADFVLPQDDKVIEGTVAAAAFQALPSRWQSALWMAEVKHLDTTAIAERLGTNSASAAALVYRARQGFSEAYLAQHLRRAGRPACAALGPKFAQYVRGTAGAMATRQIENHIDECPSCAAALAELSDVNSSLRSLTGPLSVITAAGATAAAGTAGTASMAITGLGLGWLGKAAVIAALSASLLVGGEASTPAAATSTPGTASFQLGATASPAHGQRAHPSTHALGKVADRNPPIPKQIDDATHHHPGLQPPAIPAIGPLAAVPAQSPQELDGAALPSVPPTSVPAALPQVIEELPGVPAVQSLPDVTLPDVTLPDVTLPDVTLPTVILPAIALPTVTLPVATLPVVTLPTIALSLPTLPGRSLTTGT